MSRKCSHLDSIKVTSGAKDVCEDCVKIGADWVHLRMCLSCGHTACCDSSPNQHATAHFRTTQHPIVRSAQPGEAWTWCYADELELGELRE